MTDLQQKELKAMQDSNWYDWPKRRLEGSKKMDGQIEKSSRSSFVLRSKTWRIL